MVLIETKDCVRLVGLVPVRIVELPASHHELKCESFAQPGEGLSICDTDDCNEKHGPIHVIAR